MLLVTAVMVVGIRLGTKTYVKSVSMSEAQQLCSTITTIVNDELRYTATVYNNSGSNGELGFFSQTQGGTATGNKGLYFAQNKDGHLILKNGESGVENKLLSKKSYPYNLRTMVYLEYEEPTGTSPLYENGVFTAKIYVYRNSDTSAGTTTPTEAEIDTAALAKTTIQVEPLNHVTVIQ